MKDKNKTRVARKKIIFDIFFKLKFFCLLPFISKNNNFGPNSKVTLILQEKIAKFELSHQKKVLDECSSTLENFLVKYVHISILVS